MDKFTKQQRSWNMSRIRASGTKLERKIFQELRRKGINFKKNYSRIIGKPDIAILSAKKAVFIDSDFWHGWQYPRWRKKLTSNFWVQKIEINRKRDQKVNRTLRQREWKFIRIWEHDLLKRKEETLNKIVKFLK